MSTAQQRAFALARRAARQAIQRRTKVVRLTRDAYTKLEAHEPALARVARDLRDLILMARSWAVREYRTVPWKPMLYVVAAVVYFVNPADLIPDVLAGLGFVDDAAVVAAVVRSVCDELTAFRRWREGVGVFADPAAEVHVLPEITSAAA